MRCLFMPIPTESWPSWTFKQAQVARGGPPHAEPTRGSTNCNKASQSSTTLPHPQSCNATVASSPLVFFSVFFFFFSEHASANPLTPSETATSPRHGHRPTVQPAAWSARTTPPASRAKTSDWTQSLGGPKTPRRLLVSVGNGIHWPVIQQKGPNPKDSPPFFLVVSSIRRVLVASQPPDRLVRGGSFCHLWWLTDSKNTCFFSQMFSQEVGNFLPLSWLVFSLFGPPFVVISFRAGPV